MIHKSTHKLYLVISLCLILLVSCSPAVERALVPDETRTPSPLMITEMPTATPDTTMTKEFAPEEARDAAIKYLVDEYQFTPPDPWIAQPPKSTIVNETTNLYTAQAWVVQVTISADTPDKYEVIVDNLSSYTRWEGTVDSLGNVMEIRFVQGAPPTQMGE